MLSGTQTLLVLVIGVGGGGYYNYTRNAAMDTDLRLPRPYKDLSTADLGKLAAAYETDLGDLQGSVAKVPTGEAEIDRFDASDVGGKAGGFASFQRENERWKHSRGKVFEREGTLADVRREKSIRDRRLNIEPIRIWRRVSAF
jgi:hypothetical protein